jgi:thiamine monophosphate kinase
MITAKEAADKVKEVKHKQSEALRLAADEAYRRKSHYFQKGFEYGKDFIANSFSDIISRAAEKGQSHVSLALCENISDTGEGKAYIEGFIEAIISACKASGFDIVTNIKPMADNRIYLDVGVGW